MKHITIIACVCLLMLAASTMAGATTVYLYADTAPNGYGSPAFAAWQTAAFNAAANGTFVNMANGTHPGTTTFAAEEAIVYSTGDLGKRLHWVYWVPGETITSLTGRFQAKDYFDWDKVNYWVDDNGNYVEDTPDAGWFTPRSWVNYDANGDGTTDGVMGTFGDAWWAWDDLAAPLSTNSNPYDEVNAADIARLASDVYQYQTFWSGKIRIRDNAESAWQVQELKLTTVPEPGSIAVLISGLAGLCLIRRRK